MEAKKLFYKNQAETIIKNLKKRNMDGIYFESRDEASSYLADLIKEGQKVGVGGTQTLDWIGVKAMLSARADKGEISLFMRKPGQSEEEINKLYLDSFSADIYLMSTNAITLDGELFNIDGRGNRVAALIYGPKQVYIIAGMNKVSPSLSSAIERARNIASPANCNRLSRKTPCSVTGRCSDCTSPDTICSQFVYTRHSGIPGRIHVLLVGEELGY
jgi:hypothetical protein